MSEPQGYTQAVVDILNSKLGQSITQAFTAGEEQERERIIKLLESDEAWQAIDADSVSQKRETVNGLIALIKGEK